MPSSEDMLDAQFQVSEWAVQQMIKEGHAEHSARAIVQRMGYNERMEYAQKLRGPIYRGPYSPY